MNATWRIVEGDALQQLRELPNDVVQVLRYESSVLLGTRLRR